MPKRPASVPTAMPTGQVFRRSQSAKKQKVQADPSKVKPLAKKVEASVKGNGKAKDIKEQKRRIPDDVETLVLPTSSSSSSQAKRANDKSKQTKRTSEQSQRSKHVPRTFRIVVGSYERMLFGFHVKLRDGHTEESDDQGERTAKSHLKASFHPLFSFAAHTSCISAVAAAGSDSKWLATGAGDESVRVWDLRKRKEVGTLTGHGGTIHSLHFPTRTYLLSSDSSGLINLYRTRDWALLKTMRGHTGRVNACAAHPSGKVALSVGQDGMLRMWDLMRGKGAGAVRLSLGRIAMENDEEEDEEAVESGSASQLTYAKIKHEPLDVQWSPSGARFMTFARTEVALYKTDMTKTASVLIRHDNPKHKVNCVAWLGDDHVLCGTEAGAVDVYTVKDDTLQGPVAKLVGHTNRVRAIRVITVKPTLDHDLVRLAVTASSDGKLRLFDVSTIDAGSNIDVAQEMQALAEHDTGGARLTSLDVVGGAGVRTAAADTAETDVEADLDEDDDDDEGGEDEDVELDADDVQELNDLLDIIEEARAQGIDVEGMSDLENLVDDGNLDDYGSDVDGASTESDEQEEEGEEEDEAEEE